MSRIKKLFYSALVACISIGVNFNTDARVTREVAEATLPYLMEAAGIPGDAEDVEHAGEEKITVKANAVWYAKSKIIAILDMIYTDEGQQQMVNWAVNNERPTKLAVFGEPFSNAESWSASSSNIIRNPDAEPTQQERVFQILFPCKTGTFTSFADHSNRMGYYILENVSNTVDGLKLFLETNNPDSAKSIILSQQKTDKKKKELIGKCLFTLRQNQEIENHGLISEALDTKIAKVVFVLDICDDLKQLNQICSTEIKITTTTQSEYMCRPVSAIIANKTGDCVETLYRHLINIAIQDPRLGNRHLFHIERLPVPLRLYFGKEKVRLITQKDVGNISESGLTAIDSHNKWQQSLRSIAEYGVYFNTSVAGIGNIARTLYYIAFWNDNKNITPITNTTSPAQLIEQAMNKLAALSDGSNRFSISTADREVTDPEWITSKIIIRDLHARRTINIGLCEKEEANFGHAEITSIASKD